MTTLCKFVVAACLFTTGVAHAQQIRIGVRGGLSLTKPTRTYTQDESRRYLVGPVLELRWGRLALDVSLLYQRFGSGSYVMLSDSGIPAEFPSLLRSDVRSRANVWQLPVVGKFYFRPDKNWQPFIGTGYAFQRQWIDTAGTTIYRQAGEQRTVSFDTTSRASSIGAVGAAGVQFRKGRIAITPEIRYIRWGGFDSSPMPTNPNQVQATVGITF